jgi:hypothetical protein
MDSNLDVCISRKVVAVGDSGVGKVTNMFVPNARWKRAPELLAPFRARAHVLFSVVAAF